MAFIDELVGLGGIGIILLLILAFTVFIAPLGIWAALHRSAKAYEKQGVALTDLARTMATVVDLVPIRDIISAHEVGETDLIVEGAKGDDVPESKPEPETQATDKALSPTATVLIIVFLTVVVLTIVLSL